MTVIFCHRGWTLKSRDPLMRAKKDSDLPKSVKGKQVCMKTLAAFEPGELFCSTLGSPWLVWPHYFALLPEDEDTFIFLKVQEDLPKQSKKQILYKLLNVFQIF